MVLSMTVAQDSIRLESLLSWLIEAAKKEVGLSRIYLFGSRARGDHRERSDFDLAFEFTDATSHAAFFLDLRETAPTLCELDLVDLRSADPELVNSVTKEGKLIYECT